jgi:hypothetical protein
MGLIARWCRIKELCEQLVTPYLRSREKPRAALVSPMYQGPNINHVLGALDSKHMLINLKAGPRGRMTDAHCFLCLAFNKKLKVRYGCPECRKAFHPMCFTAFHCRNALKHEVRLLIDLTLQATEKKGDTISTART